MNRERIVGRDLVTMEEQIKEMEDIAEKLAGMVRHYPQLSIVLKAHQRTLTLLENEYTLSVVDGMLS